MDSLELATPPPHTIINGADLVPLTTLAVEAGAPRCFNRALIAEGFTPIKIKVRGRQQFALSRADADRYLAIRTSAGVLVPKSLIPNGVGGVYVVCADPELRPNRVKIGWATDFAERLRTHRGLAPGMSVLRLYATHAPWTETMALWTAGTRARSIAPEVFDADDAADLLDVLDRQFVGIGVCHITEAALSQSSPCPKQGEFC
jgi:hypothetical protein